VGRRLLHVRYWTGAGNNWADNLPKAPVHEVHSEITLEFESHLILSIAWAQGDFLEGLDVRIIDSVHFAPTVIDPEVLEANALPEWANMINSTFLGAAAALQEFDHGAQTAWAVRLRFDSEGSIVVALGEPSESSIPDYRPTSLIAIFDETVAKAFTHRGTQDSAWGSVIPSDSL
jgi:hypothetical protein